MKEKNARIPPSLGAAPCKSSSELYLIRHGFFSGGPPASCLSRDYLLHPDLDYPSPDRPAVTFNLFLWPLPRPWISFSLKMLHFKPISAVLGVWYQVPYQVLLSCFKTCPHPLRPYFKINNSQNRILEHLPHSSWKLPPRFLQAPSF